nr:MAG TPA: hypothetical protein [Caudoviricetes sp.]
MVLVDISAYKKTLSLECLLLSLLYLVVTPS